MINCIRCGADMGMSISSLCDNCSGDISSQHQSFSVIAKKPLRTESIRFEPEKKKNPKDVYKNYLLKKLNEFTPKKAKGMLSHGESKGYNRAIQDVIKMIVEEF